MEYCIKFKREKEFVEKNKNWSKELIYCETNKSTLKRNLLNEKMVQNNEKYSSHIDQEQLNEVINHFPELIKKPNYKNKEYHYNFELHKWELKN